MNISCDVIKDLLPLYAENMASQDTRELVEAHLLTCPACCASYEQLRSTVPVPKGQNAEPLCNLRRQISRRRKMTAFFVFFLTASIIFGMYAYLTGPVYLSAAEAGIKVYKGGQTSYEAEVGESGEVGDMELIGSSDALIVVLGPRVSRYTATHSMNPDTGEEIVTIIASDSRWNAYFAKRERQTRRLQLSSDVSQVFYANMASGEEDLLLWGAEMNGGMQTLPRLVLGYYLLLAGALGCILTAAAFGLRRQGAGKWLAVLGGYLLCFTAANLMITGGQFAIFAASDVPILLGLMLALAALMNGAVFTGWEVWKLHRQDEMP